MSTQPERRRGDFAVIGAGTIRDGVAYRATIAGVQVAVAVALVTFACLAFGRTSTGQFQGTAPLYQYFGATAVILILVSLLPPNRADSRLRLGGRE